MSFRVKQWQYRLMWKTKAAVRILFVLVSVLALSPLAACVPQIPVTGPQMLSPAAPAFESSRLNLIPTPSPTPLPTLALGPSLTFYADADARVKQSEPDKNYGNSRRLQVDDGRDPNVESFLRFTVAGVTGSVQRATLRLYVLEDGTLNGPAVYATEGLWTEMDITWNNRPTRAGEVLDNRGWIPDNSWAEYDVTSLVKGNGVFNFVLIPDDSSDGVGFSSRQGIQSPQLVLTLSEDSLLTSTPVSTVTPVPTPAAMDESIVFVGAGDIADCENQNAELTAQLVEAIPGTVFTLGDNAYPSGAISQFVDCYHATWGRFRDRTKPVPGNHEYMTESASGYFRYFHNIAPYYAYDLGAWRIYALNSEIDVSATSPQLLWLIADLAANPRKCVLAYWHQPRWSSGGHHGSNSIYQPLWQILYVAGAEAVLNGHEHNYERFAPMNADGQADPQGIHEFVVGTGGAELYRFGPILPTSEARNDTGYGVLKLTLHPEGYDWEFIPATGNSFTDRGSAECH